MIPELYKVRQDELTPRGRLDKYASGKLIASIKDAIIQGYSQTEIKESLEGDGLTTNQIKISMTAAFDLFKENIIADQIIQKEIYKDMYLYIYKQAIQSDDLSTARLTVKDLTVLDGVTSDNNNIQNNVIFLFGNEPSQLNIDESEPYEDIETDSDK